MWISLSACQSSSASQSSRCHRNRHNFRLRENPPDQFRSAKVVINDPQQGHPLLRLPFVWRAAHQIQGLVSGSKHRRSSRRGSAANQSPDETPTLSRQHDVEMPKTTAGMLQREGKSTGHARSLANRQRFPLTKRSELRLAKWRRVASQAAARHEGMLRIQTSITDNSILPSRGIRVTPQMEAVTRKTEVKYLYHQVTTEHKNL
ncbi:hypothetical protein GGI35DRAFT_147114 [Trichoderma velutinum]